MPILKEIYIDITNADDELEDFMEYDIDRDELSKKVQYVVPEGFGGNEPVYFDKRFNEITKDGRLIATMERQILEHFKDLVDLDREYQRKKTEEAKKKLIEEFESQTGSSWMYFDTVWKKLLKEYFNKL